MSGIVGKNLGRGSGVVTATPVGADTVSGANIADDAIDSEHYTATSIDTAAIATNQIDETLMKDAFVGDFTDVTVTAADAFLYGDATDSGNTKKDTIQGILDLAGGGADYGVIRASRNMTTASGNQDITGMGFEPSAVLIITAADATASNIWGIGFTDFSANGVFFAESSNTTGQARFYYIPNTSMEQSSSGIRQVGAATALSDGVRIAWVLSGSPASLTYTTFVMGFK